MDRYAEVRCQVFERWRNHAAKKNAVRQNRTANQYGRMKACSNPERLVDRCGGLGLFVGLDVDKATMPPFVLKADVAGDESE